MGGGSYGELHWLIIVDLLNAHGKYEEWDWVTRCERERGNVP
jgi:hypothetical protein